MKKNLFLLITFALFSVQSCAQKTNEPYQKTTKSEKKMDLSKLTNENIKKALEALQNNDKKMWYSYFTTDAKFTDDGRNLDFKSFFDNAFDKKEKFLDIDKVENEGKDVYGNFYAGQWGTFRVYFKFHQNADGKFNSLDIGQAPK